MNGSHLPDNDLQLIACDNKKPTPEEAGHLAHCEICQAGIAVYRLIAEEVQHQAKPSFGFDVSALVLPQIQQAVPAESREKWLIYLLPAVLAVIGVPIYLLRKNIFYVFTGISAVLLYAIAISAAFVLTYRLMRMYREYRKRMQAINFY